MRRHPRFVLIGLFGLASSWARGQTLVYFGTYTGAKSQGIYVSSLDTSGRLTEPELAAETVNPSFLAVHPSGRFLYAVPSMRARALCGFSSTYRRGERRRADSASIRPERTFLPRTRAPTASPSSASIPGTDGSLRPGERSTWRHPSPSPS